MNFSKKNCSISISNPENSEGFGKHIKMNNFHLNKTIITGMLLILTFTAVTAQITKPNKVKSLKKKSIKNIELRQNRTKNAILESDLYIHYKKLELQKIEKNKKILLAKIKKGHKSSEVQVKQLSLKEKKIKTNLNAAESINKLALRNLKIGPVPPCPPTKKCRISGLDGLWVDHNIRKIQVTILDKNNRKIGYLNEKPYSVDHKTGFSGYRFKLNKKYLGPIVLKVIRTTKQNTIEKYEYSAILE